MKRSWLGTMCSAALVAAAMFAVPSAASAQSAVIRGTVRSDAGDPVAGASVFIVELNLAVASSDAGRFVLTVPGDRVRGQQLQVRARAVGFRPSSRAVTIVAGEQTVDFSLVQDINRLDEIVVTGVLEGTEQGKVPFAVSRVDMADVPVTPIDPLRLLAGRVAGATVTSFSGRPGASPEILLRGPHSINAEGRSQGPLFLVDGVIIDGSLPDINPADIENVEVVKGAAASSLYGARAGNGVIQITTRSGRRSADGMSFNARSEYGQSDIERDFGIARNHALIMDERNERFCRNVSGMCTFSIDWVAEAARINDAPGDGALSPLSLAFDPGASTSANPLRNSYLAKRFPGRIYNAVEQAVTPNDMLSNNVDATGRYGQTQFYASTSYLNQAGALRFTNGFQRYTARLNVDQRIGSAWSLALRSYYVRSDEDTHAPSFFRLTRAPAIVNTLQRDTLGRLYVRPNIQASGSQNENPLQSAANSRNDTYTNRFIGGVTLRYAPANWVDVEGQFAYDRSNQNNEFFQDKGFRQTTAAFATTGSIGSITNGANNSQSYNTGVSATFRRNLRSDVVTRWVLRYAYDQQDNDARSASGNTLNAVGVPTLNNAAVRSAASSSHSSIRGTSFSAGGNVEFKERYFVDGVIRREGSSLFGADARYSTFGRGSIAWRMSREPWWFASDVLSDLKVRASYGTAGNRPRFVAQYETFSVAASGLTLDALGNRDLRPEKTFDTELGMDFELFRRVGVQLTYARAETRDQILEAQAQADDGFTTQWRNAGTLENKTWELAVNLPMIQRRDLSWSMRFTYDRTRTVITELGIPEQRWGGTSQATGDIFRLAVGEEYGTFYGKTFLTSCSQLPSAFAAQCGGTGSQFQVNDDGFVVWTGGFGVGEGITRNLWTTQLASANAPWGIAMNWGMPIVLREDVCIAAPSASCTAQQVRLGNSLPRWNFGVQQTVNWRRLSVYGLLQGVMGRDVWNQGRHWAHLDFLSRDLDQEGRSVQSAKPIGYYWRAAPPDNASGVGGFYDILAPNNHFVEDASYAKLRELAVSYNVGAIGGVGNWTASVVGRNLFTITNYRGFDPEVGLSQGISQSGTVVAVDAFTFPNTRSLTFGLSTSF